MIHVMACTGLSDRKYSEVLLYYDHHTCKIVANISTWRYKNTTCHVAKDSSLLGSAQVSNGDHPASN
jgi:hypothetical protein